MNLNRLRLSLGNGSNARVYFCNAQSAGCTSLPCDPQEPHLQPQPVQQLKVICVTISMQRLSLGDRFNKKIILAMHSVQVVPLTPRNPGSHISGPA